MSQTTAIRPEQFVTFGELLTFLRRRAGLSQRELSIAVGYSMGQPICKALFVLQLTPDGDALLQE